MEVCDAGHRGVSLIGWKGGMMTSGTPAPPPLPTVIGQAYGGGFYAGDISYGGSNYKIIVCPKQFEGASLQYLTANVAAPGAASSTDGWSNTIALLSQGARTSEAAVYCRNLSIAGFQDWYLPSRNELGLCYTNLRANASSPAGFKPGEAEAYQAIVYYMTSSESGAGGKWARRMNDGAESSQSKNSRNPVRAIRRIPFSP